VGGKELEKKVSSGGCISTFVVGLIILALIGLILSIGLVVAGVGLVVLGILALKKPELVPKRFKFVHKAPILFIVVGVLSTLFGGGVSAALLSETDSTATIPTETVKETQTDLPEETANEEKSSKPLDEEKKEKETEEKREGVPVLAVVDGDTFKAKVNGKEETIRLLLVDTPETKHPQKGVQPFGPEASKFTENFLAGKTVQLEKDVSQRDKYGRLLRYVYVDGKSLQEELLKRGLARITVYPPDVKYLDEFQALQKKAQDKELGIWSIENYVTEDGFYPPVKKKQNPKPEEKHGYTGPYDPHGPDRDCGDFASGAEAQAFYEAAGPGDPHGLDRDGDGNACDWNP
jgi:micrococcal nuclease